MPGKKDLGRRISRWQRHRGGNVFSDFKNSKISVAEQNECSQEEEVKSEQNHVPRNTLYRKHTSRF